MQEFGERTGGGLDVWVHKGRYEQARQQFDPLKARLATVGPAQVSRSSVTAAHTSAKKHLSLQSPTGRLSGPR
jgi:hypothetical protein